MTGVNQKNILKELKVDLILLYASKKDTYHLIFCFLTSSKGVQEIFMSLRGWEMSALSS